MCCSAGKHHERRAAGRDDIHDDRDPANDAARCNHSCTGFNHSKGSDIPTLHSTHDDTYAGHTNRGSCIRDCSKPPDTHNLSHRGDQTLGKDISECDFDVREEDPDTGHSGVSEEMTELTPKSPRRSNKYPAGHKVHGQTASAGTCRRWHDTGALQNA